MSKKDEIISIDLDEEKEKQTKQQEIEIKAGDMYVKIPVDRSRIDEVIRVLQAFSSKLIEKPEIKEEKHPIVQEAEEEIKKTEQFLKDVEKKEKEIDKAVREEDKDKVILDQHEVYNKCPECGGKIKKKKVEMGADGLRQVIRCKNRKCGWKKEYLIRI